METLKARDAQRYADFKQWTPYEAALLFAGCKPLPRGQIPEPRGSTPAFNLIHAIKNCGPSKDLKTLHTPEIWMRWYAEHLAGRDFPEFSQIVLRAIQDTSSHKTILDSSMTDSLSPAVVRGRKRRTWRDIAWNYVVKTYREGNYRTAAVFYKTLVTKAGTPGSPFTLHMRELHISEIGGSVSEKTIKNAMPEIKKAAITTATTKIV